MKKLDRCAFRQDRMFFLRLAGAAILAFMLVGCGQGSSLISPGAVRSMAASDTSVVILDVRTQEEYVSDTGHLERAIVIPVQELEGRLAELEPYRGRTIVAYCRSGHRSTQATAILQRRGFRVLNMEGGITRWREEGLPVVRENP